MWMCGGLEILTKVLIGFATHVCNIYRFPLAVSVVDAVNAAMIDNGEVFPNLCHNLFSCPYHNRLILPIDDSEHVTSSVCFEDCRWMCIC